MELTDKQAALFAAVLHQVTKPGVRSVNVLDEARVYHAWLNPREAYGDDDSLIDD